jgi:hypothetical protein
VVAFLVALVPSAGVLFLFWIAIKALVEGDRRERAAQARIEAAQRLEERANAPATVTHSIPVTPVGSEPDTPGAPREGAEPGPQQ